MPAANWYRVTLAMPLQKVVGLISPRSWMMLVLQAWADYVRQVRVEGLEVEVARLRDKVGKQADSIWNMSKTELSEVARMELGMTAAQCDHESGATLKFKIKSRRDMLKGKSDPHMKLPKGLGKMTLDELKVECMERDIPFDTKNARKGELESKIRDHVVTMNTMQPSTTHSTRAATASTSMEEDQSWEFPQEAPRSRPKRDR